ncbi:MAG: hypothetical protein KAT09_05240 [Candidatus Aegiribacteria sp.]|nr:hypothetical protein [Candidatus Aegiribacteria sp.]
MMTRQRLVWLSRAVLLILLALSVALILKYGSEWLSEIAQLSWKPDPLLITLSALLLFISLWFTPFAWIWISRKLGSTSSSSELRGIWFASHLGRYVPGKIWLFIGRAGYLKSTGVSTLNSALAPVYELMHTAAAVGVITFSAALFFPEFLNSNILRITAVIAGICMVVLPLLHPVQKYVYRLRENKSSNTFNSDKIDRILFLPPSLSIKMIGLFSAVFIIRGLSLFILLTALGISCKGILVCIAATPLSWLAGYIVFLVPGGIGVREAVTVSMIAGPSETGPILAAVLGQRLLLAVIEVILAGISAKSISFLRREGKG